MRRDVKEFAENYGLKVDDWTPGDGVCRYRFFIEGDTYFSCRPIYTAMGRKQALVFLQGWSSALLSLGDAGILPRISDTIDKLVKFGESRRRD